MRLIAEGRDASATIDSALLAAGTPGYQNDGDNEITGFHVSNGDPGVIWLVPCFTVKVELPKAMVPVPC